MTQLRAKLFNEENLIKGKMNKMQKEYDEKVNTLQRKINNLQVRNELVSTFWLELGLVDWHRS